MSIYELSFPCWVTDAEADRLLQSGMEVFDSHVFEVK